MKGARSIAAAIVFSFAPIQVVWSQPTSAKGPEGTLWSKAYPNFREGELTSCSLEYAVLIKDGVYRQGLSSAVTGSITLFAEPKGVAVGLKVVVLDFDSTNTAPMPNAPTSAYFVDGFTTTKPALLEGTKSDTPGGYFSVFKADPTLRLVLNGLDKSALRVAFARHPGGSDVVFDIDPTVVDIDADGNRKHSNDTIQTFLACNKTLLENILPPTK